MAEQAQVPVAVIESPLRRQAWTLLQRLQNPQTRYSGSNRI